MIEKLDKLFYKRTERPIDGNYYYLFNRRGNIGILCGEGKWEEENQCFYDNNEDRTYYLEDIDYYMNMPTGEQLDNL